MIPVCIVTGFLGSGKTTLIARLLKDPAFGRTAVIVNEFGEVGLDHALIARGDESVVALTTGCLCCRMLGGLAATLGALERRGGLYERVVVETSGLADPAPLLQALIADPAVSERHRLAGVVTLVDAVHGAAALKRHVEARRQVALADRVIVTKTDLEATGEALLAAVTALNPGAAVAQAVRGNGAEGLLFGGSGAAARLVGLPPGVWHSAGLGSVVIEREAPVPALALALWLQTLAEHAGSRLLRVKGIVGVTEMPGEPAMIHAVGHSIAAPEWLEGWPAGEARSRIVVIGQDMPRYFPARLLDAIEAEVREESGSVQPV